MKTNEMMGTYRINDLFYSLQGEGHHTGMAAVFVRFSGCNLRCPFCDTDFSSFTEMSAEEIVNRVLSLCENAQEVKPLVVLTGGEPTLQVDEALITCFHEAGFVVAMESNGTKLPPRNLEWLTVSPKEKVMVKRCNELKCLMDELGQVNDFGIEADVYYLQPCDVEDEQRNQLITQRCVEYVKAHPKWRLSLQTHKLAGFK